MKSSTKYVGLDVHQATTVATVRDSAGKIIARGMREELARVTLARKIAAVVLRLWKKGEPYDATKLSVQAA